MILGTLVTVVLLVAFMAALPAWRHSRKWGFYPSGGVGLVALILLILAVTGRI